MRMLTAEQRRQWATDGYLHLEGVLDADQVAFFSSEIDRIRTVPGWEPDRRPELPRGHYGWLDHAEDLDPSGFMDRRDLLTYDQEFIDLMDRSPVFDYIVDIMGPYILLSMTQAVVRAAASDFQGYTHTDGGESLRRIRVGESSPPIAMKAMYLLTDVTGENCGNLTVFPGSHLRQIPYEGERQMTPYSPGAAQLTGKAGDVYLFRMRCGTAPRATNRAARASACCTTTASSGSGATTLMPSPMSSNAARRASGGCWVIWVTISGPDRISMSRRTRST